MGQGQPHHAPPGEDLAEFEPPAPPALHKGIRAALGHFDQDGREAGRGSRYFDSWCHGVDLVMVVTQVTDRERRRSSTISSGKVFKALELD